MEAQLREAAGDLAGRVGIAGRNLRTGDEFLLGPDDPFPTASMIKLPVLVELFHQVEAGRVRLDDRHALAASGRSEGSSILKNLDAGLQPTVRDLAFLMMSVSDNTATNILIGLVGIDRVNAMLAREGITGIELRHEIDFDYLWEEPEHLGVGTPRAFAELMERIYRRAIVSPAACDRMMGMMAGVGAERIARYLPFNPYGQELVRRGLAEPRQWVQVAGKTGRLLGVAGHVAAVWGQDVELVLAVMTSGSGDPGFGVDHPQMLAIARVGRLVYERCLGVQPPT